MQNIILENVPKRLWFKTKPISYNVMTTPKPLKTDNVPINVITIVTTHNQQL
jgi:hypothetical protein